MNRSILLSGFAMATSLLAETQVLVFAGSARSDSYNKKLAHESAAIAREMGAKVTLIDLKDYPMPLFDIELLQKEGMPKNAKRFRDAMIASQAIVIASPENNASVTALLKNAIDWASRNEQGAPSREAFKGKRFAIMSASPGKTGGARGLVHLRAILETLGGEVVEKQVTVPQAHEEEALKSPAVKEALREELGELLVQQAAGIQRT